MNIILFLLRAFSDLLGAYASEPVCSSDELRAALAKASKGQFPESTRVLRLFCTAIRINCNFNHESCLGFCVDVMCDPCEAFTFILRCLHDARTAASRDRGACDPPCLSHDVFG